MNDSIPTKVCFKCKALKPKTEFNKCKTHKDGLGSYCKTCIQLYQRDNKHSIATYQKQYHIDNKELLNERVRRHHSMHRYGISQEEVAELIKKCHNQCQICGVSLLQFNPAHSDHDHSTVIVRGILCRCCNSGLGLFQDNPKILKKAMEYLQ